MNPDPRSDDFFADFLVDPALVIPFQSDQLEVAATKAVLEHAKMNGDDQTIEHPLAAKIEDTERRDLANLVPSDLNQMHVTDISQAQSLYDVYRADYASDEIPDESRMLHAKALAFALLTRYLPASEGYTVTSVPLGQMARRGMSFTLAQEDGSDVWQDRLSNTNKAKNGRLKAPTSKKRGDAAAAKKEFLHHSTFLSKQHWKMIEADHMALFAVHRTRQIITPPPVWPVRKPAHIRTSAS